MHTINITYYTGNNFVSFSVAWNLTLDVAATVPCLHGAPHDRNST